MRIARLSIGAVAHRVSPRATLALRGCRSRKEDVQGRLFPELEDYLAKLPRLGLAVVLRPGTKGKPPDRTRSPPQSRTSRARDDDCMSPRRYDGAGRRCTH